MSDRIANFLADLERQRFFGSLTLQYRDGQLVLVRREETLLPEKAVCGHNGETVNENPKWR